MKPPYRIPTMEEIRAVEPNGYRAASLFAGCGGSSLGYRMAGYKIGYASEFVPAAADTYEANKAPGTFVDRRDVRDVEPKEILRACGVGEGELDLLDGSPPCASFSMAGKRDALWGQVKKYSDVKQRTDDLFGEYLRMVEGVRPKVAVAENVPGLTIGSAIGVYNAIMRGFRERGYVADAAILEAHWLGVPQSRRRLFFVAVREDLKLAPVFPKPLPYFYSIRDALPDVASMRVSYETSGFRDEDLFVSGDQPLATLQADGGFGGRTSYHYHVEKETDITGKAIGDEWEKMGMATSRALDGSRVEGDPKYFQLIRPNVDEPVPTITATTGQVGAASVVHPHERRKFAVFELRRLCGFPDDFVLTGTYSQKVERLGRAVCPPVSFAVGRAIADGVLSKLGERRAA